MASAAHQVGGQVEVVFGTDRIGFGVVVGATRDEGTAPDAATGVEPLWLAELGIGLVTAPFPIVRRRAYELRPELGFYGINLTRFRCGSRCDEQLGQPAEQTTALGVRLRAGMDVYWGAAKRHGLALDALMQWVQVGDFTDPTTPTTAEIASPRFLLRLALIGFHDY